MQIAIYLGNGAR